MAHLSSTSLFTSWDLTPQEIIEGSVLTITQRQCIQNLICSYATEKIFRNLDPANIQQSIYQDAKQAGMIASLQHLLDLSDRAEEAKRQNSAPDSGFGY